MQCVLPNVILCIQVDRVSWQNMAAGGAGGGGDREFYRLFVTDIPAQTNREVCFVMYLSIEGRILADFTLYPS